jgi:hypothetical protein
MDEDRIKKAVVATIEKSLDAHELAEVFRAFARGPRPTHPDQDAEAGPAPTPTEGTKQLLTRIVLGDLLDETILAARPQDRTFPLRLFFGELSRLLASDGGPDASVTTAEAATISELAFTLASGLNFFFRAPMEAEAKMRIGIEVSRQLYTLAHQARMDGELRAKSAPLLAALLTNELERLKFESVDHITIFDSQIHERTSDSDPTALNVVRPASFVCRVAASGAVKVKAMVVT